MPLSKNHKAAIFVYSADPPLPKIVHKGKGAAGNPNSTLMNKESGVDSQQSYPSQTSLNEVSIAEEEADAICHASVFHVYLFTTSVPKYPQPSRLSSPSSLPAYRSQLVFLFVATANV